ncbi:MAG: imidazolonepropionase [Actinobacteria bacterium]|uniref:imidazolonepropionase n=1 Tax=freshwater metagenome TaxID=449393 RepID=A0A6J6NMN2_9ZZZZ|nr:imidazolonepropionase [Actinomycetota bacterium]
MSSVAITDIGSLVTNDSTLGDGALGLRSNAAIVVVDGKVAWIGDSQSVGVTDNRISVAGKTVVPGFVDSHAHLVFAGDRSEEFSARMSGESYSAGGIKTTMAATRAASDETLRANTSRLVSELHRSGVTTFESKSGYALDVANEARTLRIAKEFTDETTFLGAHVVPAEFANRGDEYVELVVGEMLQAAKSHAKWIDVFCDRGAFDVNQARTILRAGVEVGLQPRIHANQLADIGAAKLAVELDCASADHLTHLSDEDVELLAASNTVATLLPGAEFSTRSSYPDARRLFAAGATVAIATDCNPGSSFITSMAFCMAVAVRDMAFSPEQALLAATVGGAKALRRSDIGALSVGMRADFVVLNAPSYIHLSYRPGVDLVDSTWVAGKTVYQR